LTTQVIFVTDPMCSWCWGMAREIDRTMALLAGEFDFDVLLGGINIDSTQPVGEFGRVRLAAVWRQVTEVTGTGFGAGLPAGDFVYNSTRACAALEAVRELSGRPPFAFLLRLQQRFFLGAEDVTDAALLRAEAQAAGLDVERFDELREAPATLRRVRTGFALAKSYGTAALPSVVLDAGNTRRLIAGGYADAPTLIEALRAIA
jgi:putative protein-disulfide isomerase